MAKEESAAQKATRLTPQMKKILIAKEAAGLPRDHEKQIAAVLHDVANRVISSFATSARAGRVHERPAENIYELFGAKRLALYNNLTRTISTYLGTAWERIARISPIALSPEIDLKEKIAGIDVVFLEQRELVFVQLKTQRNTLTGSQRPRSEQELLEHRRSLFAAAFPVASWTFNSDRVDRLAGAEFWERIGLNYQTILSAAAESMMSIELALIPELK